MPTRHVAGPWQPPTAPYSFTPLINLMTLSSSTYRRQRRSAAQTHASMNDLISRHLLPTPSSPATHPLHTHPAGQSQPDQDKALANTVIFEVLDKSKSFCRKHATFPGQTCTSNQSINQPINYCGLGRFQRALSEFHSTLSGFHRVSTRVSFCSERDSPCFLRVFHCLVSGLHCLHRFFFSFS